VGTVADSPFVGRERELETLGAAFEEARSGRVRLLALVGDAGIGKTRTVEEFVRRTELPAGRVLWGRCPEQPGAPTYWPWVRAIRAYADREDPAVLRAHLAGDAGIVARMVPALGDRLPDVDPGRADEQDPQSRFRLFDGVTSLLQRIASDTPLVVVLDDVHWADEASLLLLSFVARETRGARILLIVTYRERGARRWPRAFADVARLGLRVTLRGLDRAAQAALVASAGIAEPSPELLARLHEVTEGNPFFLDEMVRVIGAGTTSADTPRLPMPDTVREAIRRRLEPLSEDERALLALAAVIGREFDLSLLQATSGLPADVVLAHLTAAAAIGAVEERERVGAFRFSHALVREMLYGEQLPAARAGLHRRVGEALEAGYGGAPAPVDALATHYFHAAPLGTAGKAYEYSMRAGRTAVELFAYGDAMGYFERALAALALEPPDDRRRLDTCMALGVAAWSAGHNPRAREAYRIAARSARALGDYESFVRAASLHAQASPPSGAPDPASTALIEEALAAVGDGDGVSRTLLLALLARALYFATDFERCHAASREAVAMGRRVGDPTALTVAILCRQLVLLGPGSVEERLALVDESHRLAVALGSDTFVHNTRLTRILCFLERGDVPGAAHEAELMRLDAERTRLPERLWHATVERATLALLAGRFDDATRLTAEALAVRRDARDPAVSHVFLFQTYIARSDTGHVEGLEGAVRGLAADYPAVPAWRCILALVLAETGRADVGRTMLDELAPDDFAAVRRDFLFPASLAWLARLAARLHDVERATVLYRLLQPFADRNIVVGLYSPGCLGSAEGYLGLLAATAGDRDAASRHFEAALATNERMAARPSLARAQQWYAELLVARDRPGDRERAAALRASAREIAEACGMATVLAEVPAATPASASVATPVPSVPAAHAAAALEATLRFASDHWVVRYGPDAFQLKDTKGLHYLRALLEHPAQEVHVLDLVGSSSDAEEPSARRTGAGELLDPAVRAAYKQRLEDLREELDEAERFNDGERAARARREIEFLGDELARTVGLGGRDRRTASAAERARVNVTRTVAAVLKRIASGSPALGQHLAATIRTGYFCSYTPDPRVPVVWRF
jgi:tetratricopeptide (TPR) repeat protein